jgi:hypothetical protein
VILVVNNFLDSSKCLIASLPMNQARLSPQPALGNALVKTTDGGRTWEEIKPVMGNH